MTTGHETLEYEGQKIGFFQDDNREKCPKGGEHEWSKELREDGYGGQGVFCKKCNMDYGELVMWM